MADPTVAMVQVDLENPHPECPPHGRIAFVRSDGVCLVPIEMSHHNLASAMLSGCIMTVHERHPYVDIEWVIRHEAEEWSRERLSRLKVDMVKAAGDPAGWGQQG